MAHSQIILNVETSNRALFHVNESLADITSPHVFGRMVNTMACECRVY